MMEYKSKFLDFYISNIDETDHIQKLFIENGTYDEKLAEWMINNIQSGWVIYDIGANIFEYTEIAARISGKDGCVYSFEPNRELVNNYINNKHKNDYSEAADINVYPVALGDQNETTKLFYNKENIGASSISDVFIEYSKDKVYSHEYAESMEIEVRRAASLGLPPIIPDLMKIDIEGAEAMFWSGAPDFLKQSKNIIIEVGPYTPEWFIEEIMQGREAYHLDGTTASIVDAISQNNQINVWLK